MKLTTSLVLASIALSQSAAALPANDGYAVQGTFAASAKRSDNAIAQRFGQRRAAHRSKRQAPDAQSNAQGLAALLGPIGDLLKSLGLSADVPSGLVQQDAAALPNVTKPDVPPAAQNVTSTLNGTAPAVHPPTPANITEIPGNVTGTTHVAPPDLPAEVTALPAHTSALPVPVSAPNASAPHILPVGNAADNDLLAVPVVNKNVTAPVLPSAPANATLPVNPNNQTIVPAVPAVPTPSPFPGAIMNDAEEDPESIEFASDMIHPQELPVITQTVNLPAGARPITMTIIEQGSNTQGGKKNTVQHTKTVTVTVDNWPYDDDFELPTSVPVPDAAGSIAASLIPAVPSPSAPAALPTGETSALPAAPSMSSGPSVPAGVTAPVPMPSLPAGLSAPTGPNPTDVPPLLESVAPAAPSDVPAPNPSNGLPLPVPV